MKRVLCVIIALLVFLPSVAYASSIPAAIGSINRIQFSGPGDWTVLEQKPEMDEKLYFTIDIYAHDNSSGLWLELGSDGESLDFTYSTPLVVSYEGSNKRILNIPESNIIRKENSLFIEFDENLMPVSADGRLSIIFDAVNKSTSKKAVCTARLFGGNPDSFAEGVHSYIKVSGLTYSVSKQGGGADELEPVKNFEGFEDSSIVYVISSYSGEEIFRVVTHGQQLAGFAKKDDNGDVLALEYTFKNKLFITDTGDTVSRTMVNKFFKAFGLSYLRPVTDTLFLKGKGFEFKTAFKYNSED